LSVDGPDFSPGLSLGLEPSRIRLATALAAWASSTYAQLEETVSFDLAEVLATTTT
jgi:hypothetical protein